jgi:DNA polymerase-3 subunit alpha
MSNTLDPPKEFASLHSHSHFSFQDGVCTPDEMVQAAKDKGLKSIAITDHGHCHAHADMFFAAKKHGVRAIFGTEAYVIHDHQEWDTLREQFKAEKALLKNREVEDDEIDLDKLAEKNVANRRLLNRKGHLVMLACDREGLSNIYRCTYLAHRDGFYRKPRMDKKMLAENSKGIIASSACMGGVISNKLWQLQRGEIELAEAVREAEEFQEIFGKGRFFLELQFNEHENQRYINEKLVEIHRATGIPLTVTTDSHYVRPDDWETQEILHMLMTHRGSAGGRTMAGRTDDDFKTRSLYVKSAEEMWQSYLKFDPELDPMVVRQAFENSLLMDSLVTDYTPDHRQRLPTLPYPDTFRELGKRAIQGLKDRGLAERDDYQERMLYELGMIRDKGISNYFLVVQEITEAARKEMLIGPGRGSAGGSLICYALGVTNIDPIEHGLMFERFINVDRIETPDVDLDFENVDRMKEIMREKYGRDNVACISTYGTNQIKGVIKDVCRVYDIDHQEATRTNAAIDREMDALFKDSEETKSAISIQLADVERYSPSFKALMEKYPKIRKPIERLYGRAHHVGRHASGVVIGDDLPRETALLVSKGVVQTSFTDGIVNKQLSETGLVKFDILGLATLSIISHALDLIAKKYVRDMVCSSYDLALQKARDEIDPKKMDMNDQRVMKTVFWENQMCGIFQCTTPGMRKLMQTAKPDGFKDVSALAAIYRPGPLGSGMDKLFVENKRKAKEGKLTFDHPILEEILKDENGVFVYQEHILELGRKLGQLSWKDVNRLRKLFLKRTKDAQGKRDEEGEELKAKLTAGFLANGMTQKYADDMWESLKKWGRYGFNKAHAKAYGLVTMQTAYLRTYHPLEFFAALLARGQAGELQDYVDEIKKQGFEILPVDVNSSGMEHKLEGNGIRLALTSVKGVGEAAARKISDAAPYDSFLDFLDRSGANKTSIHGLIKVGAFEALEPSVELLLARHELYTGTPKYRTKKGRTEFLEKYEAMQAPEPDHVQRIAWERELQGFNLRGSPFTINGRKEKMDRIADLGGHMDLKAFVESEDEVGIVPAVVKEVRERQQKNKQLMAFVTFIDRTGAEFSAPAFSGVWGHVRSVVRQGEAYLVTLNRKLEKPNDVVVGKGGWISRRDEALECLIRLDDVNA